MCHLDGMRASKNPLPLPSPWDKAWTSISKIIDSLHISNHKDASCKEKYNPEKLKQEIPRGNTMAAEQTFVWEEIRWQPNRRLFGSVQEMMRCFRVCTEPKPRIDRLFTGFLSRI